MTTAELTKWYAPVPPEENAALILTNAFAHLVRGNTNSPDLPIIGRGKLPPRSEPLPSEMRQAIADYVATNRVALELLEKGLGLKSCRYPVHLTPGWNAHGREGTAGATARRTTHAAHSFGTVHVLILGLSILLSRGRHRVPVASERRTVQTRHAQNLELVNTPCRRSDRRSRVETRIHPEDILPRRTGRSRPARGT